MMGLGPVGCDVSVGGVVAVGHVIVARSIPTVYPPWSH